MSIRFISKSDQVPICRYSHTAAGSHTLILDT